ncbi:cytochrome-c peroxidase [Bosea sp. RCC_152_1]|uniref:cytochrome-c peroxidase n=1 Tax=Bosea sp. RCC_152_1 TaxID=3239228 RepID=UPI00352344DF
MVEAAGLRAPRRACVGFAVAILMFCASSHPEAPASPEKVESTTLRQLYAGPPPTWPAPELDAGVAFVEFGERPRKAPPTERTRALAALGKQLFFDPSLSRDGTVACSHCHDPARGWSDGRPVSAGVGGLRGRRNAPSLFGLDHAGLWGWTGRTTDLRAQLAAPLFDPLEMANEDIAAVARSLDRSPGYREAFSRRFPEAEGVTIEGIGEALEAYLAGIDETTRFDAFLAGDKAALSDIEITGLHLFRTKARCANCHFGPRLSDGFFHNLRLSFFGEPAEDRGRYDVTGRLEDVGRFRTPSLRQVVRTAPYMHNGLFADLRGVINLYDRGGGEVWARNAGEAANPLNPHAQRLSPHIRKLGLSDDEKAALLAFLSTL